jgi:hypothetical protein
VPGGSFRTYDDSFGSIRQDPVDKKYLNMEKTYHFWVGIKEFGKDGKK